MRTREQPVPAFPIPGRPSGRQVHLDVVKVAVVAGVIVGHAWAGYDALGGWAYTDAREVSMAAATRTLLEAVFGPFALFSMGLMFLIAGVLTPGSVDRNGPGRFARHRLVRLGEPWLLFTVVLWPPLHWYLAAVSGRRPGPLWTYWLRALRDPDPEHVWFLLVLLIFSLWYAAWRAFATAPAAVRSPLGVRQLLMLAAAIAVGSFLVRVVYPLGTSRDVGFHFEQWPQFVGLYALGLLAAPRGWLDPVPDRLRRDCGRAAAVAVLAIGVFAAVVAIAGAPATAFLGGWHWASAATAVVEGVLATTLSVWVLAQAQRHPPRRHPARLDPLARAAFPAYLVQGHILVGLALLMRSVAVPAEVKAATVSVCGPVLSFGLGWLLATTTRPRRAAGPPSTAMPAGGSAGGPDPGRVTGVTVELCVLLWARPGAVQALISYEDTVLALLGEHGGRLLQRARTDGTDGAPTEVQLIEFASPDGYQAYLADERRTALVAERDAAIARTELYPVRLVRSS